MLTELEDVVIHEGETAIFTYKSTATGADIVWTKEGEPLLQSDKYKLETDREGHKLRILNCQKPDSGPITIYVGDMMSTATLNVIGN